MPYTTISNLAKVIVRTSGHHGKLCED